MAKRKNEMKEPKGATDPFVDTARDRWKLAREFWGTWRRKAKDDFAFVSGDQWMADDVAKLEEDDRPALTFNYSEKMVDAVVGAEVSSREEVAFLPREVSDHALADVWTSVSKWVRQSCNAENEESDAFRDCLICGLGWTETRMDYDEDAEGRVMIERVDPLEMYSDPAASKSGLADSRYVFRAVWMDKKEAKKMWPNVISLSTTSEESGGGVINPRYRYSDDDEKEEAEYRKDQVQVLHYQTYEVRKIYRVMNPETQTLDDFTPDQFEQIKDQVEELNIPFVTANKRVYYRAFFAGETLLEKEESPCQNGFTFQALTGKRDRNKNNWYGIVRVMKDPQRWANKWLSQILDIINKNAKGGLMAESGAFVDPKKAADEWAKPDSITLLNEGGINKVSQKQMPPYPSGLDRLMDFALSSLPMVTGINLEALGLAAREQAGVLEQQRKQAAYGILTPYFDGIRLYRKNSGKILLYYMREYISDGRMVRIVGPEGEQNVQLTKIPDNIHFDIIVDQSPSSPDSRQRTWETLTQVLPGMMKAGLPIDPAIMDYMPLPSTMVQKWKAYIEEQKQQISPEQMQQMQQQMQQMQEQLQQVTQENQQMKMDQSQDAQKLNFQIQSKQAELELKRAELENEIQIERAKLQIEAQKNNAEISFKRESAVADAQMKALSQGLDFIEDDDMKIKADMSELEGSLEQISQSQQMLAQAVTQGQQAIAEALRLLTEQMNAPKRVVFDENGRPVGIRPVQTIN